MNIEQARTLMHMWVTSESLRAHMEAVAACMVGYAQRFHHDDEAQRERWMVCGLLHDMDYERHPSPQEHPFVGVKHLRDHHPDVDEEMINAILGHAEYSGTLRTTPMQKTLFAVDELAGFITACAKVRPNGISDLEPASVRKKLKDKAFAAAVSREDIRKGVAELGAVTGLDEMAHIQVCIEAMRLAR